MIRAVLFDLDGTLLDSAPDLVAALNHVRALETLPPLPLEDLRSSASYGAMGLINAGLPNADNAVREQWKTHFLEFYGQNLCQESKPFPGIPAFTEWLASKGIPWGIVTNKIERFVIPLMRQTGLGARAGCMVCGDTLKRAKPDPAPILLACELLGSAPHETLVFGDDERDMKAAASAGAVAAFAEYGYGLRDATDSDADHVFASVQQLQQWMAARLDAFDRYPES